MRRLTTDFAVSDCDLAGGGAAAAPEAKPEMETLAATMPTAASRRGAAFEDRLPSWLLRGGLAFVLLYAATSSLAHPETFARYFPSFMPETWATELLPVFAVFELLLVVGLMTERYSYAAAMLTGLTMVGIIGANPDAFDVLFRNVAVACGAFALAVQSRRDRRILRSANARSFRGGLG